jgi:hypothetical protein
VSGQKKEIELNQFFFFRGSGANFWSHYFYLKPVMYRIDSYFSHTYKSIQEYKSKIDKGISFYEPESKGLSMNLPYPQLDNGNIYDKLYHYSSLELDWDYIQNQFYDTVLNNKYFDFWGAELDYQPNQEIFGGEHWKLIVDITTEGKRKHKEITGYSVYPEGFAFFESILTDFNDKAQLIQISQNIENPHTHEQIKEKSFMKRFLNIMTQKD